MKKWNEGSIGELVLYKNNQLMALNKPAGLPVQADRTGDKSLLDLAEIYAQHPLHLIHRIDRPASGLVLLARNSKAMADLSEQFAQRQVHKRYLAVVGQKPDPPAGSLHHYLFSSGHSNRSIARPEAGPGGVEAKLDYALLASIDRYHLLRIDMHTGRHHQIRAQLAATGNPIKGDVKYGFRRGNRDRSIHLHAWQLAFRHPVSREQIVLSAPLPQERVWQAFPDLDPV